MRRWRSYYFLIIPILLLILAFQFPQLNATAHAVFSAATKPAFTIADGARRVLYDIRYNTGNFVDAVGKQRQHLARIQDLESQLLRYREMDQENHRLKKLLGFSQSLVTPSIGVRVIGEDVTPWKKIVVLDKGSRQGIKRDMAIVAPEGLAGRVLEVEPFTARAILLPDPDCRVSALTFVSRAQGVITGTGTEKLQMRYLALDAEIAVGEDVITSGIGSIFPKGLQIGKIESIERDGDGLHLLAVVIPTVPFSKLEEVLCLVSPPSK
ncbi:MAG TPA: rod shape-determining protein MreC [Candidatus Omnitrophota bacterium]|nr:rod shape-determining protein MreC [Candidatus Omnitrophota bacterium]HPS37342.1 rod shape-determining protein MreC [Candidatus Omnitrophota bacterium]